MIDDVDAGLGVQVVPVSRWPLPSSVTGRPTSPVRVVPLSRWPFPDTASVAGRLTMDGIVVDRAGTTAVRNEYVEGPSAASFADPASGLGRRRRVGRKTDTTPAEVLAPSRGVEESQGDVADSPRRRRDRGLAGKMRSLLSCVGTSPTSSSNSSSGDELDGGLGRCVGGRGIGMVCRRCGRCRCRDCAAAEQSSTLRRTRSVIDVVSCMCCIRCLFYHCLKDDAGDELDCSDEPCACSDRPHCAARWAVMGALLPCLPCLCLYVPLRCTADAVCRGASPGAARSCRCVARSSRHPGLKGLLESDSSST